LSISNEHTPEKYCPDRGKSTPTLHFLCLQGSQAIEAISADSSLIMRLKGAIEAQHQGHGRQHDLDLLGGEVEARAEEVSHDEDNQG
jgi:hypothetical protein